VPISVVVRANATDKGLELTFDGERIVVGRGVGCEVRLPDPTVSQRHATIRNSGTDYTLTDEGSTNGTYLGGVRLARGSPRTLRSGDLARVGKVWFEVRIDQTPATRDLPTATRDMALRLVADAMRSLGDDVTTRLLVVEGADRGRSFALGDEGRAYVLGRGEPCDMLLDDPDISREHVQVVRRGPTVLVRDLGSKNGAYLGEARLAPDRDVPWRAPTMLRLGGEVIALEEPVARALAELEAAPDELVLEGDLPPAPRAAVEPATTEPVPEPALVASAARAPRTSKSSGGSAWSGADLAVVFVAIAVLAMSAAGLYWLLRG